MDIHGPTHFRPRKSPPLNRFVSAYPHASQTSESATAVDELSEDDIFNIDISETADHRRQLHLHHNSINNSSSNKKPNFSKSFGILAALPESATHCYHKLLVSSSRAIPGIPKPPQQLARPPFGKMQYQSAPVNVPVLARAMRNRRKLDDLDQDEDEVDEDEDDDDDDDDEEDDGEMVRPPHEIVARTNGRVVACSVLEGVGCTRKGRI